MTSQVTGLLQMRAGHPEAGLSDAFSLVSVALAFGATLRRPRSARGRAAADPLASSQQELQQARPPREGQQPSHAQT